MPADAKRKEARKRKLGARNDVTAFEDALTGATDSTSPASPPAKKRKQIPQPIFEEGTTSTKSPNAADGVEVGFIPLAQDENQDTEKGEEQETTQDPPPTKPRRFIVFIGNLPYNTTTPALSAHFSKISPKSIRHRTDPKTGKSKGFAFLEFDNFDRMKTCLKLYHHSLFVVEGEAVVDGGEGKGGKGGRRINVELTAGGGGKGEGRRERVKSRNDRLGEERHRRAEAEAKAGKGRGKKGMVEGAKVKEKVEGTEGEGVKDREKKEDAARDIHPSRRGRVLGNTV